MDIFESNINKSVTVGEKEKPLVDLITFSTMIKGYCKYSYLEKGFKLFELMKTKNIQSDEVLYNSLLDGCSKNGKLDLAFKLY